MVDFTQRRRRYLKFVLHVSFFCLSEKNHQFTDLCVLWSINGSLFMCLIDLFVGWLVVLWNIGLKFNCFTLQMIASMKLSKILFLPSNLLQRIWSFPQNYYWFKFHLISISFCFCLKLCLFPPEYQWKKHAHEHLLAFS